MIIKTGLRHFAGMKISVDGEVYEVSQELTLDVPKAAAEKLLQSKNWIDPEARKSEKKASKGITPIVTSKSGQRVEPKPTPDPIPEAQADPEVEKLLESLGEPEEKSDEGDASPYDENGEPCEEWPEPDEEMDLEYLRTIASAYGVEYKEGTRAKTLVKKINAVMFE